MIKVTKNNYWLKLGNIQPGTRAIIKQSKTNTNLTFQWRETERKGGGAERERERV